MQASPRLGSRLRVVQGVHVLAECGANWRFFRPQRGRSVVVDGVYNNAHFMHAATSYIGSVVRVQTASGQVWEGQYAFTIIHMSNIQKLHRNHA